jgi:hypothetical protein
MEYDPRGLGNTAWITTLPNGGGSSKIVKIALEDGPSSIGKAGVLSMLPTSLDFGNVDTGKSKTMHAQLRNSGDAPLTVSGLAVTPAGTAFSVGALLDPHLLNAGDTLGVDVTFAPIVGGSQSASLSVAKADGSSAFALTGVGIVHSSGVLGSNIPAGYSLDQNYPNPSGLATTIPFAIPVGGEVEIRLLDDLGRIIFSDEKYENAGDHEREIELGSIPNGTYLYELRVGGLRIGARKMTLLR